MQLKKYIRYTVIALVAMLPLIGAEYHGTVKFNNLPMPGRHLHHGDSGR